jgi:putative CRISPR-associated protein (TIGR02619 family)
VPREIICTVGTSLLTNRDDRPWSGWNPAKRDPLPDAVEVDAWLRQAAPEKASAETNTLRLLEPDETDALSLLHSDTPEGRFCAERLAELYRDTLREVLLEKIGQLGYAARNFSRGLKALVDVVLKRVRAARELGRLPVFCATGGFKAEIAFMNLMGALLEIEVVYIHELHRELVRLPRLPLAWDAEFVARHRDFFLWIDAEPRKTSEVESWLKARPQLRFLVEDAPDGYTYLSPAGDLLNKVAEERLAMEPRATWPAADARPPEQKNLLASAEHHRPPGWEPFVRRVCEIDAVRAVRYDAGMLRGPRVRILDAGRGVIGLRYEAGGLALPLAIETTARGDAQTEHVAEYLRTLV